MLSKNDVPFAVTVGGGPLPEYVEASFNTSGFEGGNGSTHELTLTWGAGSFEPEILRWPTTGEASGVRLQVHGDWELEGMLDALIALGDHLRVYRDVVLDRKPGRSLSKNPVDL